MSSLANMSHHTSGLAATFIQEMKHEQYLANLAKLHHRSDPRGEKAGMFTREPAIAPTRIGKN